MGEIDRINPIIRPVLGPRTTDRVQPGSDRGRHHAREDEIELHDRPEEEEATADLQTPEEPATAEHGLDLSI